MRKCISIILCVIIAMQVNVALCAYENIIDYTQLIDPMKTSDEAFFGEWNSSLNQWSTAPVLRYDDFPALSSVLSFVKSKNYVAAKNSLLNYYKERSSIPAYNVESTDTLDLGTELLSEKIVSNQSAVKAFSITSEKKWYAVDLTMQGEILQSYMIFDRSKEGGQANIYTKESDYAPYVIVKTSAGETRLECIADTYLQASAYSTTNYGSGQLSYVQENAVPFDSDTKRAYLNFDTKNFPTGSIESIIMYIYAQNVGADEKQLVLYDSPVTVDMDESSICWNSVTPGTFNYKNSIFRWDQPEGVEYEWINSLARLEKNTKLIKYYKGSGENEFAYRAMENTLNLYAYQNTDYPRPLDTAWRTPNLLAVIFNLYDCEFMTGETFTALLKYAAATGESLCNATEGVVNQRLAIRTGFLRLVLYIPEIFPSDYSELAKNKLFAVYRDNVLNSDATYKEATSGYIGGVLDEMAETISLLNVVQGYADEQVIDVYTKLALYYSNLSMPDGKLVPYGDGGRVSVRPYLTTAAELTGNLQLLFHSGGYKNGEKPSSTSIFYPNKKLAVLRDGWNKQSMYLFTNAETGGQHSHPDDLHIDLYAYGSPLLIDAGNAGGYNDALPSAYVRKNTLPHNTVEINGSNQSLDSSNGGEMTLCNNPSFNLLEESTNAYDGFTHKRTIMFVKGSHFIVTDYIMPQDKSTVNSYKQAWHPDNDAALEINEQIGTARTHFAGKANLVILQPGFEEKQMEAVRDKSYIRSRYLENKLEDFVYYTQSAAGDVVYNTVLYPIPAGEEKTATSEMIQLDNPTNADAIKMTLDGKRCLYYTSRESIPSQRTFEGYTFSGKMLYTETAASEDPSLVNLVNASSLARDDGTSIISSEAVIPDISVAWSNSLVKLDSSTDITDCIRIYAPNCEVVEVNGKEKAFLRFGDYIEINSSKLQFSPVNDCAVVTDDMTFQFPVKSEGVVRNGSIKLTGGTIISGNNWDGVVEIQTSEKNTLEVSITDGISFSLPAKLSIPFYRGDNAFFGNGHLPLETQQQGNLCVFQVTSGGSYYLHPKGEEAESEIAIYPSSDTFIVRNSTYKDTNYDTASTMKISSYAYSSSNCRMAVMRFNYGDAAGESIRDLTYADRVYLDMTLRTAPQESGTMLIYGLTDNEVYNQTVYNSKSDWKSNTLTGSNASSYGLNLFDKNCSEAAIDSTAQRGSVISFDVTDYVKAQPNGEIAFKLYAQKADGGADFTTEFYSNEVTTPDYRPVLRIVTGNMPVQNYPFEFIDADCSIRRNSTSIGTNYADNSKLYVHSAKASEGASRYSFFKFDESDFKTFVCCEKVFLTLSFRQNEPDGGGSGRLLLYGLEDDLKNGWAEDTMTGNLASSLGMFKIDNIIAQCEISGTEVGGAKLVFDVTDYVKSQKDSIYAFMLHAEADEETPVYISVYSSECGKEEYMPYLSGNGISPEITGAEIDGSFNAAVAVDASNITDKTALITAIYDANHSLYNVNKFIYYYRCGNKCFFSDNTQLPDNMTGAAMLIDIQTLQPIK